MDGGRGKANPQCRMKGKKFSIDVSNVGARAWSTNTFAFESQGYIFFLSTSNQRNVIKYNTYEENHGAISESEIKNSHYDTRSIWL